MGGIYSSVGCRDGYIGKYFYLYAMYLTGQLWQFHFFLMIASLNVSHTCHTSDAQHLSLSGSCQRILILEIPMCPSSPSKSITQPCSSPMPISATPPQFINNKYVAHFQVSIDCYKLFLDIH